MGKRDRTRTGQDRIGDSADLNDEDRELFDLVIYMLYALYCRDVMTDISRDLAIQRVFCLSVGLDPFLKACIIARG